ncbi:MAG: molecular chaperone HtpG [Gammaproteobacteria bacterium]|jgi:molecular chaperone HtpG|nr:molecular chaperone HtpG [Gammaproteobacteria bacterium]
MTEAATDDSVAGRPQGREQHSFQTEAKQLLHLMVHSLYSNREIFLRELISNAADACDKLRFLAVSDASLLGEDTELRICISVDAEAKTITISDNGIGMNHDEVIANIGTIARSGTREFLQQLQDSKKDQRAELIGQFGVGFYSAFIVADEVTVETRHAGADAGAAVRWQSAGEGEYTLEPISREQRGTDVIIKLKDDAEEFLQEYRLRSIIQRYSGHISFPVQLLTTPPAADDDAEKQTPEWQTINDTTALWTRPKTDISDEEYIDFYKSIGNDSAAPLTWTHNHVEGAQSYKLLLFVPGQAPYDMMFNRDERQGLKLYVQRVLIMDAAEQLLPNYLRFVRGVVDSADLPLNVSREILQENDLLQKIRSAVVKRSLTMLEKLSADADKYQQFWKHFGTVLKEGIVEDMGNRDEIAKLLRFPSTRTGLDGSTSLSEYIENMAEGQDTIWYVTADNLKAAAGSPHLEWFREQGIEVLLLGDRIDEWLMGYWFEFDGKSLKSIAKGKLDTGAEEEPEAADKAVLERLHKLLEDRVESVTSSARLKQSVACLVLDENAMAMHMQQLLQQAGQDVPTSKPGLEVNLQHPLWQRLQSAQEQQFEDLGWLLYEQAVLSGGGQLDDPAAFVQRTNRLLTSTD